MNVNKTEDISMVQTGNTCVVTAVPSGAGDEQGAAAAGTPAGGFGRHFAPGEKRWLSGRSFTQFTLPPEKGGGALVWCAAA